VREGFVMRFSRVFEIS